MSTELRANGIKNWYNDIYNDEKRYSFDLNENSIIFNIGAHKGHWLSKINNKYKCNIYAFEPILSLYISLLNTFSPFQKVRIFNYGISNETKEVPIYKYGKEQDGSSLIITGGVPTEIVKVKSFTSVVKELDIKYIDLIEINAEGSEYDILDQIIASNFIHNITYLLIQFHNINEIYDEKRYYLKYLLSKTHIEVFNFDYVFECWRIK